MSATRYYQITVLLLSVLFLGQSGFPKRINRVLKFGKTGYIMINPDLAPLKEKFSVSAWIKLKEDISPVSRVWFHYRTAEHKSEIIISDDSKLTYMLGEYMGEMFWGTSRAIHFVDYLWYHVCVTFSNKNKTAKIYYGGEEYVSVTTTRELTTDPELGSLVIGQYHRTHKMEPDFTSFKAFSGEITELYIFSKCLTKKEVESLYLLGNCSSVSESVIEAPFLSWNTLLSEQTEKHGDINKINYECPREIIKTGPTTHWKLPETTTTPINRFKTKEIENVTQNSSCIRSKTLGFGFLTVLLNLNYT